MTEIGRRIYYDTATGEAIQDTGERSGDVIETTIDYDISVYKQLSERNRESFDVIQLEFAQYSQDFRECDSYRINPETKELEFSYPDPTEEQPETPVYRKPLSTEVEELKVRQDATESAILDLLLLGGM